MAATVTSARISFKTTTDNKDGDSKVRIGLWDLHGTLRIYTIYSKEDDFGDNTVHDLYYDLTKTNNGAQPILKSEANPPQKFSVTILPTGSDTWKFIPTIILEYSDGVSFSYTGEAASISDENPSQVFVVH